VIEFQEAADAFAGLDLAGGTADPVCGCREQDRVVLTKYSFCRSSSWSTEPEIYASLRFQFIEEN
jgi:hypothetical protein